MAAAAELRTLSGMTTADTSLIKGDNLSPPSRRERRLDAAGVCAVMGMIGIGLSLAVFGCDVNKQGGALGSFAGESRDTTAYAGPIIRTAKIVPTPVTRNAPLEVYVEAEGASLQPITIQYQWIVNGAPVAGETGRSFDPARLNLGDRVSVDLIPVAASGQGPPFHIGEALVQHSPPVVKTIAIQPSDIRINTPVQAYVETIDVDHEPVRMMFRWRRNDEIVQESEDALLSSAAFRAGDVITVEATPSDLHGMGQTARSEPVVIQNSPPTVTTVPPNPTSLESYEYAVHAIDPDGDPIHFSLISAPPGMTIGEKNGLVVWRIPSGTKGTSIAKIAVEDDHGGSTVQDIQLTLPTPAGS